MTVPRSLMLFAAGLGTRMGALTRDRPKPLIEVAGRTLLEHALDQTRGVRLDRMVVNAHWHADQIIAFARRHGLETSLEMPDLLDTGGGLKKAAPLLEGAATFTLNTDAVWRGPPALKTLAAGWDPDRMDALLLLIPQARVRGRDPGRVGDFALAPDGRLTRGGTYVYSGAEIIALSPVLAEPGKRFSLNRVWDRLARAGRLFGTVYPGLWCDVGRPAGIGAATDMLKEPADDV